ncbi:hypothetical protein AAU61_13740 [Desulfocarbo indianensis]|nr:hypothetical protein AAU61_13740 [Desulfocarbo indianensis]
MPPNQDSDWLKKTIADLIADVVLPGEIMQRVKQSLEVKPNPEILDLALARAKERVREVVLRIPQLNTQSFFLRVPGPEFLEFVLVSEYILMNSVEGEQGSLRYLQADNEPVDNTLANCLHALGFHEPEDLEPYHQAVRERLRDGETVWGRMVDSLKHYPKGK